MLARRSHLVTAVVAIAALVLQTGLVTGGESVLAEREPPDLGTQLGRLISYFTIQSNLLLLASAYAVDRRLAPQLGGTGPSGG